ncbi:hypothetical protein D9M71_683570 [compost metagenome]
MHWQQLGVGGTATTIEFERVQPQHVHTKTHGALGEAGLGVEDKTLSPLLGLALRVSRVGKVAVDVEVARGKVRLGVFEKVLGNGRKGRRGQRQP